jgi:transcriptional regulator with XRE-family HTH domain
MRGGVVESASSVASRSASAAREAPPAFGELLARAMREKGRALGRRYTFKELADDSGVGASFAGKAVRGVRVPSRAVVEAWALALAPYLPLDEALAASGFCRPSREAVLERLTSLTADQLDTLDRVAVALGFLPPALDDRRA